MPSRPAHPQIVVCYDGSPGATQALRSAAAEAVAEEGAAIAARAGLKTRPLTVRAARTTADAILRVVSDESATAVVIGRATHRRVGPLMSGHVSPSVIDRCPVPVVVA